MKTEFNKIFQIGFNKCGTCSIHHFFLDNDLKSIHWGKGRLAIQIQNNYNEQLPLLTGYEDYKCFTDMENLRRGYYIYLEHFKELDKQYPNSKFILNLRNIDNWIESRLNHHNYFKNYKNIYQLNDDEVIPHWKNQWSTHIESVKEYFKSRPEDLLIFDIETEQEKFINFMSKFIEIKSSEFGHHNKTSERNASIS